MTVIGEARIGRQGTHVLAATLAATLAIFASSPHAAPAEALTAEDQDVHCRSYYRASDATGSKTGTRIVLRGHGDTGSNRWENLVFRASLWEEGDPRAASVTVTVRERGESEPLTQGLYQAGVSGFVNAYSETWQGFTGLIYVNDPDSRASLQFICKAVKESAT